MYDWYQESKKRAQDSLELELQMAMTHLVGAQNCTWILSLQVFLATEPSLSFLLGVFESDGDFFFFRGMETCLALGEPSLGISDLRKL